MELRRFLFAAFHAAKSFRFEEIVFGECVKIIYSSDENLFPKTASYVPCRRRISPRVLGAPTQVLAYTQFLVLGTPVLVIFLSYP